MIETCIVYCFSVIIFIQGVNNRRIRVAQMLIVAMLAILAFCFQPLNSDDLLREFSALDGLREYGWDYFGKVSHFIDGDVGRVTSSKFDGIYVTQLIYYLFSRIPVYNVMPAVIVGVQFFLEFKLLNKLQRKYNLDAVALVALFIALLCFREYRYMASGIRNQLAMTIAVYILYSDIFEKKNFLKCCIGYILCGMIHQTAYIVLLIRLIVLIPSGVILTLISIGALFWSNLVTVIKDTLVLYVNNPVLNSILWKMTAYTEGSGDASNLIVSGLYGWVIRSNYGIILLVVISAYIIFKNKTAFMSQSEEFYKPNILDKIFGVRSNERDGIWIAVLTVCFALGASNFYWMYLRIFIILHIWMVVVAAIIFSGYNTLSESDLYYSYGKAHQKYLFVLLFAVAVKFGIMTLFVNTSFNFNLFGLYPR